MFAHRAQLNFQTANRIKAALKLQSRTTYLSKVEKSNKIGHERKSLISAYTCFLTAIAKI